jgi:hypothetical protein
MHQKCGKRHYHHGFYVCLQLFLFTIFSDQQLIATWEGYTRPQAGSLGVSIACFTSLLRWEEPMCY